MRVSVLDENGVFQPRGNGKTGGQKVRGYVRAETNRIPNVQGPQTQKTRRIHLRRNGKRASVARKTSPAPPRYVGVEKTTKTLQSPATEVENRIYVPLRDIVEALGMGCHWVEPGIICVGSDEHFGVFYVNGGLEKIKDLYNY